MSLELVIQNPTGETNRAYSNIGAISLDLFETLIDLDKERFEKLLNERLPKNKTWVKNLLSGEHGKPTIYNAIRLILFGSRMGYTRAIRRYVGDRFLTGNYDLGEVLSLSAKWVCELSNLLHSVSDEEGMNLIYIPQRDPDGKMLTHNFRLRRYRFEKNSAEKWAKRLENYKTDLTDIHYLQIMLDALKESMVINKQAIGVVRLLKNSEIKIGLISDTASCYLDVVRTVEQALGFSFDAYVYSCDIGRKKIKVKTIDKSSGQKENNYVTMASLLLGVEEIDLVPLVDGKMANRAQAGLPTLLNYLHIGNSYIEDAMTLKRIKANGILYIAQSKLSGLITAFGKNILNVPMATFAEAKFENNCLYLNSPL